MDIFAHTASGMLLGRAFQPAGPNWRSFLAFGAIAGILPDLDLPIALLGHDAWFRWHQVLTHSLPGLIFLPLLPALIPFGIPSFKTRYFLALSGWTVHVCLDLAARWPVPLLWPLSDQRWTFRLIRADFSWIIDMLLLIGLALSLWEPAIRHGRRIAVATFAGVAAWLLLGFPT